MIPAFQYDDLERRSFEFYIRRAGPFLSGPFDQRLWCQLVPQLCQRDPVFWDAAISMSLFFEHPRERPLEDGPEVKAQRKLPVTNLHHRQALQWYNRSVGRLRRRMEQNLDDEMFALLSCVLFAGLEFQQINVLNALRLMENAFTLLVRCLFNSDPKRSRLPVIEEIVILFFSRHALLMSTFGHPLPNIWAAHVDENVAVPLAHQSLESLEDIQNALFVLLYRAYELVRIAFLVPWDTQVTSMLQPKLSKMLIDFEKWRQKLDDLLAKQRTEHTDLLVLKLLMYYNVSIIWLSTCATLCQSTFDHFHDRFLAIIEYARVCIAIQQKEDKSIMSGASASGLNIIPPLFFTATKCRHPTIRRQALSLIREAPAHEGFWAVLPIVKIIEKIMMKEEEGYDDQTSTDKVVLPPEKNRGHHIQFTKKEIGGQGPRFFVHLTRLTDDGNGHRYFTDVVIPVDD